MSSWNNAYLSTLNAANSALSVGTIIGIVIGCLAGLATLIGITITIFCVVRRNQHKF